MHSIKTIFQWTVRCYLPPPPLPTHTHTQEGFFSFNPHPYGNFTSVTSFPRHLKLPVYLLGISLVFYRIFIVVCSVTWPLNGSEAGGDLVLIQISLLLPR